MPKWKKSLLTLWHVDIVSLCAVSKENNIPVSFDLWIQNVSFVLRFYDGTVLWLFPWLVSDVCIVGAKIQVIPYSLPIYVLLLCGAQLSQC